jgi:hypothetical protein
MAAHFLGLSHYTKYPLERTLAQLEGIFRFAINSLFSLYVNSTAINVVPKITMEYLMETHVKIGFGMIYICRVTENDPIMLASFNFAV